MITLRIWLRHGTELAAPIHVTHPHCSPIAHQSSKGGVCEVELHDYAVDELAIADGTRVCGNAMLCAISAEAVWLDGKTHLVQHIVARGRNICDVMELYFIALQAKDVATHTRQSD